MSHPYRQARFLLSAPSLREAPPDVGAEVAFAGRSNAGKSSAINTLTGHRGLARTSKTPGRTQQLVFFQLDEKRRLVDLPGYGYAQVPEAMKHQWQKHMAEYLRKRRSLRGLVLVMDIRHPLTDYDRRMLEFCQQAQLPVHILLTKSDKLKKSAIQNTIRKVIQELEHSGVECSIQLFSSLNKSGVEDVHAVLDLWLA